MLEVDVSILMVALEWQFVLPYSLEEFHRGYRYLIARQAFETAQNSKNSERFTPLERGIFSDPPECVFKDGALPNRDKVIRETAVAKYYGRNEIDLGVRLPGWVRFLFPQRAFIVYQEFWNAFPYTFARYTSAWLPDQVDCFIETYHVAGQQLLNRSVFVDGTSQTESASKSATATPTLLDISEPPPAGDSHGVFHGDPRKFCSSAAKRGPLVGPRWWEQPSSKHVPMMTVYKRAACHIYFVPTWVGRSKVEDVVLENVRELTLHAFRNMFCWLDDWYSLSCKEIESAVERFTPIRHPISEKVSHSK